MTALWMGLCLALTASAQTQTIVGRWEGTVVLEKLKVPFQMHITAEGAKVSAAFANGPERVNSTSGTFENGMLKLKFDQLGTEMNGRLGDGGLKGTYGNATFEASLYCTCGYEGEAGPDISGEWKVEWNGAPAVIRVRREGEDTLVMLTSSGVTAGPAIGRFDGLEFALRYFDGARAFLLNLEPKKDGTLAVIRQRPGAAAEKGTARR